MTDVDDRTSTWAADTRELRNEARLVGPDWPATEPAYYVAEELRTTTESVERGTVALEHGDPVTAVMHARLMVEMAIRMAWVKAPFRRRDRIAIAERLWRLIERDIDTILGADEAVQRNAGFPMVTNRKEVLARVAPRPTTKEALAPGKPEILAREANQPALYGVFRYLSTLAHPGLGQKLIARGQVAPDVFWQYLRYAHAGAVLHGVALLDGLGMLDAPAPLPRNEAAFLATGRLADR